MRCAAIVLLLAAAIPALAADQWVRLSTPNFELYTDAGDKAGRETIQYFEQVRDFFIKAAPVRFPAEFPVRVIVFKNREEFAPYSTNAVQVAYYAAGARRDYIVMAEASPESYAIAVHEYMHLIVRRSGLHIPVWLNEGLAEVYSTLRPVRDGVAVGDLIPGRMQPLASGRWLTFDSLTSVNSRSAVYNEADRVGIFYGESWALAHMLFLSPAYRDNFGKFLMALNRGKTSVEACQIAFGKSSDQVFEDLKKYLDRSKLSGRIFITKLTRLQEEPAVSALPEFDSRLMLADLLLDTGRRDRAKAEFQQLERQQPNRPEVTRSLGYFSLAAGDLSGGRAYLEKAFAAGDTDPQMCFALALLERDANQPPTSIVPPLERAIQNKPDFADALIQLGLIRIKLRRYDAAIEALMSIKNVTPAQAVPVFSALAYAYLETGDLENAGANADTAEKWIKNGAQLAGFGGVRSLIAARKKLPVPPTPGEKLQHAEGILQTLDCKTNPRRLVLMSASGLMPFSLPDPAAVEFSHNGGGSAVQMTCGPQEPRRIVLDYAPGAVIRRLEY